MPNHQPLVRSMEWQMAKKQMPDSISRHLPSGDPSRNHEEIKAEIDRMLALGPEGRDAMKAYVNEQISEDQLEQELDKVSKELDRKKLEMFRENLRIIRDETRLPVWKEMIPVMYKVDMYKVRKAAARLQEIKNQSEQEDVELEKSTN